MKILRISLVIVLVFAGRTFNANAQTETILHEFPNSPNDGDGPAGVLLQGNDGNFYGTCNVGGLDCCEGTVFRISPSGTYTTLYSFVGFSNDGIRPAAGLVQGSDGNFYGTTFQGGNPNLNNGYGYGTVFRITPSGSETNLHSFGSSPTDGQSPEAGLVQGSDGNFYGTTTRGGASQVGTVFRISPSGCCTSLYSFGGGTTLPYAGLVQGSDGNFYGATSGPFGGNVFRISPSGTYTSLYSFGSQPNDGTGPLAGLVQGSDGNFYGTTQAGGIIGYGTVFRISLSGTYTSLYSFGSSPNDGKYTQAGLVQGSDGNFYGTTQSGGTSNGGTIFRISPSGIYTSLYSFGSQPNDGTEPLAGLVQGSDGNFYGTTYSGGTNNGGTVFKLSVPPNPVPLCPPPYPINQITNVQVVAQNIIFGIPSIAGEIYQLQFTTDLTSGNWINEGGSITSIGALLTLTNFGGASLPQGFYRFAITP